MRHFTYGVEATPSVTLTPRELRLLRLLCLGRVDKEIAVELGVTHGRAKHAVRELREGLGVPSRIHLVAWAMQRPEVFRGASVHRQIHPEGCGCSSPYCGFLQSIQA